MMTTLTFDQVLTAIRQLPPHERARLVAIIVEELAAEYTAAAPATPVTAATSRMTPTQAHAVLADLRETFSKLSQPRLTLGEQLERDRVEREASIEGTPHVHA